MARIRAPAPSLIPDAFHWPTGGEIHAVQLKYLEVVRNVEITYNTTLDIYIVSNSPKLNGRIWIPREAKELQVSLCILAHCSLSGHRGLMQTMKNLEKYFWEGMENNIRLFVRSCLQCNQLKGGKTIPRPYGRTFIGKKPNEVISFDYLYMGKPASSCPHSYTYIMVIKDTYSMYVMLIPCERATARNAVQALSKWIPLFGVPRALMSDRGSHFKNEVVRELCRAWNIPKHHFTLAYCPWSNGSVERVNRDIIGVAAALIAEQGSPYWHWPYYLDNIIDVLNSFRSDSLGGLCPRQMMTGLAGTNVTDSITIHLLTPDDKVGTVVEITSEDYKEAFGKLFNSLRKFYSLVDIEREKRLEKNNKYHNK